MLEVEYKSLLDKDTFEKIRSHYEWDYVKTQTNHYYYDPKGILAKNHITVRIREIDGVFRVQVKAHKNPGEALQICEETEFEINSLPEIISEKDTLKYTGSDIGELYLLGSLTTLRYSLMWNKDVEICLDQSDYFDVTDYEIEVEYVGSSPDELMNELGKFGVEFNEKSKGKYSRFVSRLTQLTDE